MSLMDETTHISATVTNMPSKDDDSSAVSPRLDKWADDKSTNTAHMFGNPLTPPHNERETPTLGCDNIQLHNQTLTPRDMKRPKVPAFTREDMAKTQEFTSFRDSSAATSR